MVKEHIRRIAEEIDIENILHGVQEIESEGDDCVRIDYNGDRSIWLYQSGSVSGNITPRAKKFLIEKGFDIK